MIFELIKPSKKTEHIKYYVEVFNTMKNPCLNLVFFLLSLQLKLSKKSFTLQEEICVFWN